MSKIYKALARAEKENGSRLPAPDRAFGAPSLLLPEEPAVELPEHLDEYEKLKVMLSLETGRSECRCVMLVSALPGEGVSTVTLGLASTMAAAARQGVLAVDLAASGPALTSRLGLYPRCGLSEVLAKEAGRSEAIVESPIPRLFVLGRGRALLDLSYPASLALLEDLLKALRSDFDYLIIDGGALKTSPDSLLVASRADAVVLVVQAERTGTETVREASERLRLAGANLPGVVLNRRREYLPRFLSRRI
jgi:Mrp family chromosome partitioning ATPase